MSQTRLYNISCKSYQIFTTTSHYRGHSAIVCRNTNFAMVYIQVTVGGCLVEYEYATLQAKKALVWGLKKASKQTTGHMNMKGRTSATIPTIHP